MAFQTPEHIETILKNLPFKPGVYLMKDKDGQIIYIGKAKRLRHRVRSYFTSAPENDPKTLKMRSLVADIDFIVANSEVEALILEENMIKRHKPRFNILMKDDKRYPYIKINWADDFPRVETTRQIKKDGNRYFGPYSAMWAVQNTLRVLRKVFPYLTCERVITGKDERACLFWDIGLCNAPCIGNVDRETYRAMIQELMDVLSGKSEVITARLTQQMIDASEAMEYEKAASLRDQLQAIDFITQKHKAVSPQMTDHDVIALARDNGEAVMQILFIRNGKLIGSDSRPLDNTDSETDEEIISQFITQFYGDSDDIPRELILPQNVEETRIIESWLSNKRGGNKVQITVPQRGNKRQLIDMAQENALEAMKMFKAQWEADTTKQEDSLTELQQALELPRIPNRIECYDISTTQGTAIVASRVMFVRGIPRKSEYRKFNIRTVTHDGSDDYQSMREALTRRFTRYINSLESPIDNTPDKADRDETWRLLPDLLLIDGGKGQLNVAVEVLKEFDLFDRVPVASLAKRHEELFLPHRAESVFLSRQSTALYLVQRIRDEAHRFAITSHRQRRNKIGMVSKLETIPGIGTKKRRALLQAFDNSIDAIRSASIEELMQVNGITLQIAESIKELL